jgi:hypothetical protein
MAAVVTGSKTVTQALAPHLPASLLTTLMSIAVENMTIAQYQQIGDALNRSALGSSTASLIGQVLK